MMWNPVLLDIYRDDPKGLRTLVIQNIQENVREENLQNYLEIICTEQELTDVCFPLRGYGVAIAISKTNINVKDIERFQEKASKRRFEGCFLNLELLCEPDGIFLPNVPSTTNEEYLSLYFESRKSGGEEDTVQNVEIVDVDSTRYAMVDISSTHAIKSILSKQSHQLRNETVKVHPYYKTVHGYITTRINQREDPGSRRHQTSKPDVKDTTTVETTLSTQQLVEPPSVSYHLHGNNDAEVRSNLGYSEKFRERSPTPKRSVSSDWINTDQRNYDDNLTSSYDGESTSIRTQTPNTAFRLRIISDDGEDQSPYVPNKPREQYVPVNDTKENMQPPSQFSQDTQDKTSCSNKRTVNIAAVKPVVRNVSRQLSDEGNESNRKYGGKYGRKARASNHNDNRMPLTFQEEIQLSSAKINMMIIFKFQSKTQSETVDVTFKENEGKVIIKGYSEDDIRQAKLKMYECLDQVVCVKEILPRMKCKFLARDECRKCIRSRCIKQKIKAAFSVDVGNTVLLSFAFSSDEAKKGLQFIKDEITVTNVQLRPGQETLVVGDNWERFIHELDTGLSTIYIDATSKNICIESFIEAKSKDIFKQIVKYLIQNVPIKTSDVTLETVKARCFKSCFEDSLRRLVEKSRGKLNVEVQSRSPFKIRVCVEGEETLTAELTKMVDQIWHERIDFDKISEKAEDKWLIMKGLDGPTGKDFFSKFESSHKCFIQVSNDGVINFTRPSVRSKDFDHNTPSDVESSPIPSTQSGHFKRRSEWDDHAHNFDEYLSQPEMDHRHLHQFEMDDDEAFELARAMSLNEEDSVSTIEDFDGVDFEGEKDIVLPPRPNDREASHHRRTGRRPYLNQIHRSASSPDFRRHLPTGSIPVVKSESIRMMRTTVTLLKGEIARQTADVLVNIVSQSHSLTESIVSKAFVKRAGPELIQLYDAARLSANGSVVTTGSCGRLKCKSVMHVVLRKGEMHCQQVIQETIQGVLQGCQANGYNSVMFPPLGVGRMYKYPADIVADRMLSEIYLNIQNNGASLYQVTIVIYDDPTYAEFEKAFKSFDENNVRMKSAVQARPHYAQDPFGINVRQNLMQQQRQQQGLLSAQRVHRMGVNRLVRTPATPITPQHHHQPSYKIGRSSDSTKHSSRGRGSRHGNYRVEEAGLVEENSQTRVAREKRPPRHRFSERKPAPNLCVVVVAADKNTCIQSRNNLGKKIRDEFLHEDVIGKRQKISDQAKAKIIAIIEKHNIESIKGRQGYTLKGHKESVTRARMDILEVLLGEKDITEKRRKRKENTRRETKEFVQLMVEEEPEVPSYWSNYKSDVSLKSILTSFKQTVTGRNYEKIQLNSRSQEFNTIVSMINSTFDATNLGKGLDAQGLGQLGYSQLHVLKIQRIENLELYDKFTSTRQKMFLKLGNAGIVRFPRVKDIPNCTGPIQTCRFLNSSLDKDLHTEINEVLLFHGTKKDNVGTICSSGFDHRLGSGRAMLGAGIYGAETSIKADQYADDKATRTAGQGQHKKMFLMRMILGNSYICTDQNPHKYRRPPCTSCYKDDCKDDKHAANKYGHLFHSVIGDNAKLFREFVVYDSTLCYPEYIITYERR